MQFFADLAPSGLFGWHPAIVWVVVGALLIVLEIAVPAVVPSFVIGPFGVAAFLAALAALLGANSGVQLVLFVAAGIVLAVPARRFLARRSRAFGAPAQPASSSAASPSATPVGKVGTCVEPLTGDTPGTVFVDGVRWDAVLPAGLAATIQKGAFIEVVAVEGTQLVVRPRTPEASEA